MAMRICDDQEYVPFWLGVEMTLIDLIFGGEDTLCVDLFVTALSPRASLAFSPLTSRMAPPLRFNAVAVTFPWASRVSTTLTPSVS